MTIKELRQHFKVFPYKTKLLLFSLEEGGGRSVHKYICSTTKQGTRFSVEGMAPTGNIDALKKNVHQHVTSLPYDSDYYSPMWRKGTFEHFVIHDYLESLGIVRAPYSDEGYLVKVKNGYDHDNKLGYLHIDGLSNYMDDPKEEVKFRFHIGESTYSWVGATCKRNVEDIKKAIDSLLKPYLTTISVDTFQSSEKMLNAGDTEIYLQVLTKQMDLLTVDYKAKLKQNLLEMAEKL